MSETKLKPCPFCGGKPVLLKHNDEDYYKVFCECCGARQWTFANRTDRDAIRNWNTRKPMVNIVKELKKKKVSSNYEIEGLITRNGYIMGIEDAINTVLEEVYKL